jgi:hypothetical protein
MMIHKTRRSQKNYSCSTQTENGSRRCRFSNTSNNPSSSCARATSRQAGTWRVTRTGKSTSTGATSATVTTRGKSTRRRGTIAPLSIRYSRSLPLNLPRASSSAGVRSWLGSGLCAWSPCASEFRTILLGRSKAFSRRPKTQSRAAAMSCLALCSRSLKNTCARRGMVLLNVAACRRAMSVALKSGRAVLPWRSLPPGGLDCASEETSAAI